MKPLLIRCAVMLALATVTVVMLRVWEVAADPLFFGTLALIVAAVLWVVSYGFHHPRLERFGDVAVTPAGQVEGSKDTGVRRLEADFFRSITSDPAHNLSGHRHLSALARSALAEARWAGIPVQPSKGLQAVMDEAQRDSSGQPIPRHVRLTRRALTAHLREIDMILTRAEHGHGGTTRKVER